MEINEVLVESDENDVLVNMNCPYCVRDYAIVNAHSFHMFGPYSIRNKYAPDVVLATVYDNPAIQEALTETMLAMARLNEVSKEVLMGLDSQASTPSPEEPRADEAGSGDDIYAGQEAAG